MAHFALLTTYLAESTLSVYQIEQIRGRIKEAVELQTDNLGDILNEVISSPADFFAVFHSSRMSSMQTFLRSILPMLMNSPQQQDAFFAFLQSSPCYLDLARDIYINFLRDLIDLPSPQREIFLESLIRPLGMMPLWLYGYASQIQGWGVNIESDGFLERHVKPALSAALYVPSQPDLSPCNSKWSAALKAVKEEKKSAMTELYNLRRKVGSLPDNAHWGLVSFIADNIRPDTQKFSLAERLALIDGVSLSGPDRERRYTRPIHIAARHNDIPTLIWVLNRNRDVLIYDEYNLSPFDYAYAHNNLEAIAILRYFLTPRERAEEQSKVPMRVALTDLTEQSWSDLQLAVERTYTQPLVHNALLSREIREAQTATIWLNFSSLQKILGIYFTLRSEGKSPKDFLETIIDELSSPSRGAIISWRDIILTTDIDNIKDLFRSLQQPSFALEQGNSHLTSHLLTMLRHQFFYVFHSYGLPIPNKRDLLTKIAEHTARLKMSFIGDPVIQKNWPFYAQIHANMNVLKEHDQELSGHSMAYQQRNLIESLFTVFTSLSHPKITGKTWDQSRKERARILISAFQQLYQSEKINKMLTPEMRISVVLMANECSLLPIFPISREDNTRTHALLSKIEKLAQLYKSTAFDGWEALERDPDDWDNDAVTEDYKTSKEPVIEHAPLQIASDEEYEVVDVEPVSTETLQVLEVDPDTSVLSMLAANVGKYLGFSTSPPPFEDLSLGSSIKYKK